MQNYMPSSGRIFGAIACDMHAVNEVRRPVEGIGGWGKHPNTVLGFEDAAAGASTTRRIPPESHADGTQQE